MTSDLKVESDCDCLMWRGRVFQTLGAEKGKAREPNDRLWRARRVTKSSWDWEEDGSEHSITISSVIRWTRAVSVLQPNVMYMIDCVLSAEMSPVVSLIAMTVLITATTAQRFQFCGGRDLIHAVIRVCSRSLPDELQPPSERSTTPGECWRNVCSYSAYAYLINFGVEYTYGTPMSVLPSFAERKR